MISGCQSKWKRPTTSCVYSSGSISIGLFAITLNHIEVLTSYMNQNLSIAGFSGVGTKVDTKWHA
jgi:hypothetical protein